MSKFGVSPPLAETLKFFKNKEFLLGSPKGEHSSLAPVEFFRDLLKF